MSIDFGPSVGDALFLEAVPLAHETQAGRGEAGPGRDDGHTVLSSIKEEGVPWYHCFPWHVYWPTVAFIGVQMSWAAQIGYVTPTLRELGLSSSEVGYTWLAGPIAGVMVQPLLGVYSDYTTHPMGRRRIYIIIGTVLAIVGLLVFSNCKALGQAIGGDTGSGLALGLGITSFWFLDFSINVAQGVQRPLLADVIQEDEQPLAHAFFAMNNGCGKLLGYGLGSISLVSWVALSWFESQLRALFTITAVVLLISSTITCIKVKERQYVLASGETMPTVMEAFQTIYSHMRRLPVPILRAFAVQFFAYTAWFTVYIYASDWFGETIYGGDPSADDDSTSYELFESGVEVANSGLLLMAAVSVGFSVIVPHLVRRFGIRIVWGVSLVILAVCLICTVTVDEGQVHRAIAILAVLGIPLACTFQIPWTIVTVTITQGGAGEAKSAGSYSTIFNLSQCLPEILISLFSGSLIEACNDELSAAFVMGGILALIGAALCYFVIDPLDKLAPEEKDELIKLHPRSMRRGHRRGTPSTASGISGDAGERDALLGRAAGGHCDYMTGASGAGAGPADVAGPSAGSSK